VEVLKLPPLPVPLPQGQWQEVKGRIAQKRRWG
jgi:hypothetical protein